MRLLVVLVVDMIVTPVLVEDMTVTLVLLEDMIVTLVLLKDKLAVTQMPAHLEEDLVTLTPALLKENHISKGSRNNPVMVAGEDNRGMKISYILEQPVSQVTTVIVQSTYCIAKFHCKSLVL